MNTRQTINSTVEGENPDFKSNTPNYKDTREPIPYSGFKYPSYQFSDTFPVLGAVGFWDRNKKLKKQFKVFDSAKDIAEKVVFYTAHATILAGTIAMAIEPVREKIFDVVEKIGNYFM